MDMWVLGCQVLGKDENLVDTRELGGLRLGKGGSIYSLMSWLD